MTRIALPVALAVLLVTTGGAQQNRSRPLGPGKCGPVDPSYLRIASETGGQPFFFSPAELGTAIVGEASGLLLLWASAAPGAEVREYPIPVDPSVRRLTVAASFDRPDGVLHVLSPDGTPAQSLEKTTDSVSACSHVVAVDGPAAGSWSVRVSGSGRYWLTVRGRSELEFQATFIEASDDPDRARRVAGQPVAGRPAVVRAEIPDARLRSASLRFMTEGGRLLDAGEYPIDLAGREHIHAVELPPAPFRVALIGVDADGNPFQRVHPALFRAATVEVSRTPTPTLVAGRANRLDFVVRNSGAAADFQLTVYAGAGRPATISPATLSLASGGEAPATVTVSVPEDTPAGTAVSITVTAEARDDPHARNAVVQELRVVGR